VIDSVTYPLSYPFDKVIGGFIRLQAPISALQLMDDNGRASSIEILISIHAGIDHPSVLQILVR
jgi:hypothetical protein